MAEEWQPPLRLAPAFVLRKEQEWNSSISTKHVRMLVARRSVPHISRKDTNDDLGEAGRHCRTSCPNKHALLHLCKADASTTPMPLP